MTWLVTLIEEFAAESGWRTDLIQIAKTCATPGPPEHSKAVVTHDGQATSLSQGERTELLAYIIEHLMAMGPLQDEVRIDLRTFKAKIGAGEREVYDLRRPQAAEIVQTELRSDLFDGTVDTEEGTRRVDIQELLEISYDEYLELGRPVIHTYVNDQIGKAVLKRTGPSALIELESRLRVLDLALALTLEQVQAIRRLSSTEFT